MVNVGSLPMEGNALFDLDTQAGITAVLLSVRGSDLPVPQKNELRDLVFSYTNGGKEQTVRLALEQKIAAAGLVPIAPKASVASMLPKREPPTIGTFRNTPSFTVPPVPVTLAVEVQKEPKVVVPESVVSSTPVYEPVAPSIAPEPLSVKPAPLFSRQPQPLPESIEPSVVLDSEVVVPPIAMPKADQQQYLERIREIKAAVNEKVGNPVNLVDINNEVGREYMSALLDAMKRINSGMSATSAMQRLEVAYVAVEETLRTVDVEKATQSQTVPTSSPEVSQTSSYEPPAQPSVQSASVYTPPPVAQAQSMYVAPEPPVAPSTPVYEPVASPVMQYQPVTIPVVPPQQIPPVVSTPRYVAPAAAPTVHTPAPHTFSSLADMVQQSHAQAGLPTTPAAPAPLQSGDPLLSSEVEEGLDQLLLEWSIFKKSGIFGTGPKGREHPLYKKMAELQIPLLLAGRFEGATQEVRQSLTDYMNGWRYEQGLIYEKGELFEHYLRRVIRHILDQHAR